MIIHRERRRKTLEIALYDFALVNIVAARRARVDFLKEREVGVKRPDLFRTLRNARFHAVRASCPRLLAAVHKEREIGGISSETEVLRDDGVLLARPDRAAARVFGREREVVLYSRIRRHDVNNVAADDEHDYAEKRAQRNQYSLYDFVHNFPH